MILPALLNRRNCGFFSDFFFSFAGFFCLFVVQVANVLSAAYLADGCFATHNLPNLLKQHFLKLFFLSRIWSFL